MAQLENITVGTKVVGLEGNSQVHVVAVKWHGTNAITVTYKNSAGHVAEQILYREDESRLNVTDGSLPWSFDSDANLLRLTSEAYRINLAHIFDPYLAVHTSAIEPLPHQISAVYQEMLSRLPLRYILADDPGSGKTIMTGLFLKELLVRGDLKRCMIVSPGNLAEQWQDELFRKFNLRFEILTNDRIESAVTGNVFTESNLCIVRLDKLSRNEEIQEKLRVTDWDLIVCDEAHKMSATVWGGEVKYTKRFQLGRLLSSITRHFLLLTATPHNGKEEDFQLFMSLIDQDRFEGVARSGNQSVDVSDVMRRLVKEDLLKFDGTPLFPERRAYTVNYDLSPMEATLYTDVTNYVQEEFNRADNLEKERKNTVGFALTILQRRLASSPEAIYQSLKRRRERLESRLLEERLGNRAVEYTVPNYDDYDDDDMPSAELEDTEEKVVDQASASQTIAELEAEIATLKRLERMANDVRQSGEDRKWDELSRLLQDDSNMFGSEGVRDKLIIFTEHRDTLRYLTDKIRSLLGSQGAVVTIHGGMLRDERRKVEELFKQDKEVRILIATDAAGEGINLQRAHLMVNYDLPWNPNRLEQRFGRIHRIGQTEVCRLWNLVAEDTREGEVFIRLLDKIEEQRLAYQGEIFNVLGTSLGDLSLTRVLREAIRYGEQPEVRARMWEVIDEGVSAGLQELLDEQALASEALASTDLEALRRQMEDAKAKRLQPHFIRDAFLEAFDRAGGRIERRERGRYEITHVPASIRERAGRAPVSRRYERITFDISTIDVQGTPRAELLAPGHSLHDATLQLVIDQYGPVLDRGTVLTSDSVTEPTLLVGVLNEVLDSTGQTVSKRFGYSVIGADGITREAGPAPYLDYAPADESRRAAGAGLPWLRQREKDAVSWVIAEQLPVFAADAVAQRTHEYERIRERVATRLTHEVNRLYAAALKTDADAAAGKRVRYSADTLRRRAEDLEQRRETRLALIDRQLAMSPLTPRITAIALVVPTGSETGAAHGVSVDAAARAEMERRGVDAVLDAERALGRNPEEQAHNNPGFDVLSRLPEGAEIRIEVKARIEGADTFKITRTEVLTALNAAPDHRLALVRVSVAGPQHDQLRYIGNAFEGVEPSWLTDFDVVSHNLPWDEWWARGSAPF